MDYSYFNFISEGIINGSGNNGISLTGSHNNTFTNLSIENNTMSGFYLDSSGEFGSSTGKNLFFDIHFRNSNNLTS